MPNNDEFTYIGQPGFDGDVTYTYNGNMSHAIDDEISAGNQDPINTDPNLNPDTPAEMGEMLPEEKLIKLLTDIKTQKAIWSYSWKYNRSTGKLTIFYEDSNGCGIFEVEIPTNSSVSVRVGSDGKIHYGYTNNQGGGGGGTVPDTH